MSLLLPLIAAIGTAATMIGQHQTNQKAKGEANKNRLWQEQQTNTAHQRQVTDLRAAGLNPILSANSGASSGGGAQAQQSNVAESAASGANDVARLSFDQKRQRSDLALQEAQIDGVKASTRQADSAAIANKASASKAAMETEILKKDLPRSEVTSSLYEFAKKKWAERMNNSSPSQKYKDEFMKDFDKRIRNQYETPKLKLRRN